MENSTNYPHTFPFNGSTFSMGTSTYLSIELKETLAAPVLLLYRLKKFNQNYRSFLISIDEKQLNAGNAEVISDCKPFRYPGEYQNDIQGGYYSPCGTIAWSTFNDSFRLYKIKSDDYGAEEVPSDSTLICDGTLFDSEGNSVASNKCRKKDIVLSSVKYGYKPPLTDTKNEGPIWKAGGDASSSDPFLQHGYYYGEPGHLIPETTDEDFIVWSTPSYLPDFSNIYRVIETDLEAGTYLFEITELYSFPGEKHIVLATRTWLGSSHLELGGLTTALGAIAVISALLMVVIRYPFATQ